MFSVADLFAGCGGLSHGFVHTGFFAVVLGLDNDRDALTTFEHNHRRSGSDPLILDGDIRKWSPREIASSLAPWELNSPGQLDVLVGGLPCEGFSQNKRLELIDASGMRSFTRNPLDSTDPRNMLFRYFLAVAAELRPKVVVIENVPQMLTAGRGRFAAELQKTLMRLDYRVTTRVLLAADYGVPQLRKRAIVVGTRMPLAPFQWPTATHSMDPIGTRSLFGSDMHSYVTVGDAIRDLPRPTSEEEGIKPVSAYPHLGESLSAFARTMRSALGTPMNHVYRVPGEMVLTRLRAMQPGMRASELPASLRPKSHYYNCYGRLQWDQPAKTITKSCNYLGSGCFGHPVEDRGITMREAARLQSFEDDFAFLSRSEPHVAKMVGSAVPPLLASAIARQVVRCLQPSVGEGSR